MEGTDGRPVLPAALARLADAAATGCLHVRGDGTSRVHLRAGRLQAVALAASLPARPLGARLLAAGLVAPAALAEAEEAQRSELQGWRLGELLVHLGHAEPTCVAAHVRDQLVDDLRTLLSAPCTATRFRPGERVRGDVAPPLDLPALLVQLGHDPAPVSVPDVAVVEAAPVEAVVEDPAPEVEVEAPLTAVEVEATEDEARVEPDFPVVDPAAVLEVRAVEQAATEPQAYDTTEPTALADEPTFFLAAAPDPSPEPSPEPEPGRALEPRAPTDSELAAANTRDFADAFASFSGAPPAVTPDPVVEPDPGPVDEPVAEVQDAGWARSDTDTAALLRELSSLGGPDPAPSAPPPQRPAAPSATPGSIAAQRKRKGLFGAR